MAETAEVRTNCRSCWVSCGIFVTVDEDDKVVAVRGDREHPRTKGYLCPKGSQLVWGHNRPDRLDHPELNGKRAGWDETLDDLAGRIARSIERGGPDSFGAYFGSGSDSLGGQLLRRLKDALGSRQLFTPLTVDIAPTLKAAELVTGFAGQFLPKWEYDNDDDARLLIYIGSNPLVSHGYVGAGGFADGTRKLRAFRARGGRVWVIDPVETRTARLADEHLAPIPGSDPAVMAWLVREVLAALPADAPATRTTRPEDRARLAEALRPFDLATVAALSGLAPDRLEHLLADIRAAGRIVLPAGTGVTFGPQGVVGEWLRWALLILTDSLEQPGGMWFDPGWANQMEQQQDWIAAPAEGRAADAPASRPDLQRMFGETPCAALPDEIEAGNLTTLMILGASPLTAIPNPARTERALRSLDALAVIDVLPSPLTAMATHLLPATGQMERADLSGMTQNYPQLSPAAVAPVAERRHAWRIIAEVADRLGVLDKVIGEFELATVTEDDMFAAPLKRARNRYDELQAAGPHGLDSLRRVRWVTERALPDGQWRLAPPLLVARLGELLRAHTSAAYPLILACGRLDRRLNSYGNPARTRDGDTPALRIAQADAEAHAIADRDRVTLSSAHGAVTVEARIDPRIRPGVVTLAHGWHQANAAALTDGVVIDPLTAQPQMSAIPVAIAVSARSDDRREAGETAIRNKYHGQWL